jgi:hypothetical protein
MVRKNNFLGLVERFGETVGIDDAQGVYTVPAVVLFVIRQEIMGKVRRNEMLNRFDEHAVFLY